MAEDYEDIIGREAPRAENPLPMEARAAQFAPFAALGDMEISNPEEPAAGGDADDDF